MLVTREVISQIKKRCRGNVVRVNRCEWDGMDDPYGSEGYNLLLAGEEITDVAESLPPDFLEGEEIPECLGWVRLDLDLYGKRGDYLTGGRTLLLNSDGSVVWYSHAKPGENDKVGQVVARHFGLE